MMEALRSELPLATSPKPAEMPASEGVATTSSFIDSMTFAHGDGKFCDCDECENDAVPDLIRDAAAAEINKRKAEQPSVFDPNKSMCIRQTRTLVRRGHGISVWRYELPPERNPEPIVEYRNSHRIIFVRTMSPMSRVLSIGKGILGSKAEKESRRRVSWIEGASFLLPYSKGVATGWIHRAAQDVDGNEADQKDEKLDKNFTGKDGVEPIVFYAIKATSDAIKSLNDYMPTDVPPWIMAAHELLDGADEADKPFVHEIGGFEKSADETQKVSQVIDLAEGKT
mmetsp:Transcript_23676/g.52903  ORF Transcript_23676/g.52903 Transcript_23676/m.52903 type:complete len:283 (+) Transcript_23676:214-1062(+)